MARAVNTGKLDRLELQAGKLVATHKRTAAQTDYTVWNEDPLGFIRTVLKCEPWDARQLEIIETVRRDPQTAVKGCVGAGKDAVAAWLALWACYARWARVIITGPTQRQIDEILFGQEIAQAFRRAKLPGTLFQRKLEPAGTGPWAEIIGFVSKDVSSLTGFHAPEVFTIITEAQGVEEHAWEAVFATALGEHDRFLVVGNPLEPLGRFYQAFNRNSGWTPITISMFDHPNIIQGKTVIPGGPTLKALERIKREEGEGSRYWIARVLALFPTTASDAIVTPAWVDAAMARNGGPFMAQANGLPLVIGIDPSRTGGDEAVGAVVQGPCVREVRAWDPSPDNPTNDICDKAELLARDWGMQKLPEYEDVGMAGMTPGRFIVDVALMGGGVVDELRKRGWDVEDFNGSRGPDEADEPSRYENLRAYAYWLVRDAHRLQRISLPEDQRLREELLATRYEPGGKEGIKIIRKKELRSALGRSPDRADAVMMGWFGSHKDDGVGIGAASSRDNLGF